MVSGLSNILHFVLIRDQKIDQTSFITIESAIYLASLSTYSMFPYSYTDLTMFSTTLIGSYGSFGRVKFSSYLVAA